LINKDQNFFALYLKSMLTKRHLQNVSKNIIENSNAVNKQCYDKY